MSLTGTGPQAAMPLMRGSPFTILVVLGLLALNGWIALAAWHGLNSSYVPAVLATTDWTPPSLPPSPELGPVAPLEAFGQSLSRPLLSRSRKPYVPVLPAAPPPVLVPIATPPVLARPGLQLAVSGIMFLGPANRRIRIVSGSEPAGRWAGIGEVVDGWTLVSIDNSGADFQRDGTKARVELYAANQERSGCRSVPLPGNGNDLPPCSPQIPAATVPSPAPE